MKKFKVKIVRIVKEFDILTIDAESKEEAEQIVQDQEYPNVNEWEHLDTLDETITVLKEVK